MKKYKVKIAFSLDKVLYLPGDELYGENVGGPVYRLYSAKTRKTIGTMVHSELIIKLENNEK